VPISLDDIRTYVSANIISLIFNTNRFLFAFTPVACSTFNVNEKVGSSAGFNTIYWQISRGLTFWPTLYTVLYNGVHIWYQLQIIYQNGVLPRSFHWKADHMHMCISYGSMNSTWSHIVAIWPWLRCCK